MRDSIICNGLTSSRSGARYVEVQQNDQFAIVELRLFAGNSGKAIEELAHQNIVVIGPERSKKLRQAVEAISDWSSRDVIETVGWNGQQFMMPCGKLYSGNQPEPPTSVQSQPDRCQRKGAGKKWKKLVARPLVGQDIPTFLICFMFAPLLLDMSSRNMNIGIVLFGPPGSGKTTLLGIGSSLISAPTHNSGKPYFTSMHTTINGTEETMRMHKDLPLLADEANLFMADKNKAQKADAFQTIAFKFAGGVIKARYGTDTDTTSYRLGLVVTSNEPLASYIGVDSESAKAASDRIITIPVPTEPPYVFNFVPDNFKSGRQFAQGLIKAAEENYGHAMPRFVRELVRCRQKDEQKLRLRIESHVERFCKKVSVDNGSGSAYRVAEAFGLVYAAGRLAKDFGILPGKMGVMTAAVRCYHLHLQERAIHIPFKDRLVALTQSDQTVRVNGKGDRGLVNGKAVVWRMYPGYSEVWIPTATVNQVFPDWPALRKLDVVRALMTMDGNRISTKKAAGAKGKKIRVYCFRIDDVKHEWMAQPPP